MGLFNISIALICFISSVFIPFSLAQNRRQDYLDAHNKARAEVGVGPMHWDSKVAAYAQNYANKKLKANACYDVVHSGGPYGENLAAGQGNFTGLDAVKLWVDEKQDFNYKTNFCCSHYTQVVWRNSVRLGCARVGCKDGWWFVICSYAPRGNIVGQHPF